MDLWLVARLCKGEWMVDGGCLDGGVVDEREVVARLDVGEG